jgi:putative DNA primase/helicase
VLPDYNQIANFITSLTGNVQTPVAWQYIYDPDKKYQGNPTFTADLATAWPSIQDAQAKQFGVFITINRTDGRGRKLENITGIRAIFADWDGTIEPIWTVQPHLINRRSPIQGHAYWLADNIALSEFGELQRRIAFSAGTDRSIINLDRVMRVPGTWHFKDPSNPQQYRNELDVSTMYPRITAAEARAAFPIAASLMEEYERLSKGHDIRETEAGLEDTPERVARYQGYLKTAAPVAVDGSGNAQQTVMSVAAMGRDMGLTVEKVTEMMESVYDPRCQPPWVSTGELGLFERLVSNAYRYPQNAAGCRTTEAVFTEAVAKKWGGNFPAPLDGWEKNSERKPPDPDTGIQKIYETVDETGAFLELMIDNKTPAWDKARIFLLVNYPESRLLHMDKTFYRFDGRIWEALDDEDIDAKIGMYFADHRLPPNQIKGIFDSLRRMTHRSVVPNGSWLDGTDASDVAIFENGIIDLSDGSMALKEHTPELFKLNGLDYAHEPAAQCPTWLAFLESIWPNDPDLHNQLQEWLGYLMVADTTQQKCAIFVGKPRAGKGTITRVIQQLLGEFNMCGPGLEELVKSPILDLMSSKLVAMIPDARSVTPHMRQQVLSKLLAIIGEDSISFDRKYKGAKTMLMPSRIILTANDMPSFIDPSGALAARMLVFPFFLTFLGREDRTLSRKLSMEIEGIATWALAGLIRLRASGVFTEAQSGRDELDMLSEDMSPLSQFIDSFCVVETDAWISIEALYSGYIRWTQLEGIRSPMSKTALSKGLRSSPLPVTPGREKGGKRDRGFHGLALTDDAVAAQGPNKVIPFPTPAPPTAG